MFILYTKTSLMSMIINNINIDNIDIDNIYYFPKKNTTPNNEVVFL